MLGSDSELPHAEPAAGRDLVLAVDALDLALVVTNGVGEVTFSSPAAQRLFEQRSDLALLQQKVIDSLRSAVRGELVESEIDLSGPPSASYRVRCAPLLSDGTGGAAVAMIEDITTQRKVDLVRRDFVANISHELKTPVGAVALLTDALHGELDQAIITRLSSRIVDEVARVGATIDDLLELSRIELGDDTQIEALEISDLLETVIHRMRAAAESRTVRIEVSESARVTLLGDRRQLVSAITNLVDNAIKYSRPDQTVEVQSRLRESWLDVVVTDHGIGIPRRDLTRVFERFYRVDRARSRETGGTGLGLAIVRHIANNHGGEVTVDSREGTGSVFTLSLPLLPENVFPHGGVGPSNHSAVENPVSGEHIQRSEESNRG